MFPHLMVSFFLILAILSIYGYLIVYLICIFLSGGVESVFICLLVICISYFVKVPVLSFAHYKIYVYVGRKVFFSYSYDSFIEI